MTLTASQYIKAFLMKLLVILINVIFVSIFGRSEKLSKAIMFQITNVRCYKIRHEGKSSHSKRRQTNYNVIAYEKFVGMISDSTLPVTFKKSQLIKF